LANKKNFDNIKMRGTNVKITGRNIANCYSCHPDSIASIWYRPLWIRRPSPILDTCLLSP